MHTADGEATFLSTLSVDQLCDIFEHRDIRDYTDEDGNVDEEAWLWESEADKTLDKLLKTLRDDEPDETS